MKKKGQLKKKILTVQYWGWRQGEVHRSEEFQTHGDSRSHLRLLFHTTPVFQSISSDLQVQTVFGLKGENSKSEHGTH